MKTKTSMLDLMMYEKPPYYEHEVITNLEELTLANTTSSKELNKNFKHIVDTIDSSASQISMSINEAKIQASIENERIARGISETNYKLQDIVYGIEDLQYSMEQGNKNIVDAIGESKEAIVNKLSDLSFNLEYKLSMVNDSLDIISNQLSDLIKKIARPNETEALELADQARINLSLNKPDVALKVTRKALELSNGTSITVLAYHILTLSLFNDEASKKEILQMYKDYVNLITFKLSDSQSEQKIVVQELVGTLYPVMATMRYNISKDVIILSQNIYSALGKDIEKTDSVFKKPLNNDTVLELITHPNYLRELHWSVILNDYVIKKRDLNTYASYIVALAKSRVLIKNELMILAIKYFNKEGFLYSALIDALSGNSNETLNNAIKIIISVLPQDIIDINDKTYWTIEVYAKKYDISVNSALKNKIIISKREVEDDIYKNYTEYFDNYQSELTNLENEIVPQLISTQKEHQEISKKRVEEWEKHNDNIYKQNYDEKIKSLKFNSDFFSDGYFTFIMYLLAFIIIIVEAQGRHEGGGKIFGFMLSYPLLGFLGIFAIYPISIFISKIFLAIIESNITNHKAQLASKHNIQKNKEKLDAPYIKKISAFKEKLINLQKNKREELALKLNSLIDMFMPSNLEQITSTTESIRENIENTILKEPLLNKKPKDLKYNYKEL